MSQANLTCQTTQPRRQAIRSASLNGLDYLEVSEDQRHLTVYFLGKAPAAIAPANLVISGGRRIQGIRVIDVAIVRNADPELDDAMQVTVDRAGDFSDYQLRLVELDEHGHPTEQPLQGFDRRYAQLSFSFKVNCPSDLDCQVPSRCPEEARIEPEIDYLAKDYASFRQLILDRLALILPDWRERHVPDLGITLVELLAYVGDYLSYYQDAVATEAYLGTARQRISVRRHARLMDYAMHEGCNARAWVCLHTDSDLTLDPQEFFLITGGDRLLPHQSQVLQAADLPQLVAGGADAQTAPYDVFEPLTTAPIALRMAHNEIHFYTWGDRQCCLPKGATTATLTDAWETLLSESSQPAESCPPEPPPEPEPPPRQLQLQPGDILIFEEIRGAKTGNPADADRRHRHAVRLTHVEPGIDALYNQPIVEITWAAADALPFALCISALVTEPVEESIDDSNSTCSDRCRVIEPISVARGNVMLVDHGQTIDNESLGTVMANPTTTTCEAEGQPTDPLMTPARFAPSLQQAPLTFSQPLDRMLPAARWLTQEPQQALPQIWLTAVPSDVSGIDPAEPQWQWTPRLHLLDSGRRDRHFVAEIDNQQRAQLRFGDGELGQQPAVGLQFTARYRVGNGTAGNVGAETIAYFVWRQPHSGVELRPRNPLPAQGGIAAESIANVKLLAPQAFRRSLQRAIIPDDYARLAEQYNDPANRRVQRAAAHLRWTGLGAEIVVAIDPLGQVPADRSLLEAVQQFLQPYRRIGHRLRVVPARYVPLDIALTVCVQPDYQRGQVKAALLERFSTRRLPDGSLGFFHADRLSFGGSMTISQLVGAVMAVEGVESVTVTRLQRLFEDENGELAAGILALGADEIAQLDNDPSFPEQGKLMLDLRGGR
jgi:hypothetical protein